MKIIKYLLIFSGLFTLGCNNNIKECTPELEFTINDQWVPSGCDIFGIPDENDKEILAVVQSNRDIILDFKNTSLKYNPNLKIKLGKNTYKNNQSLIFKAPSGEGIISIQACLNNNCNIKYVLVSNDKTIIKKIKVHKKNTHIKQIAANKSKRTNQYNDIGDDYQEYNNTTENSYNENRIQVENTKDYNSNNENIQTSYEVSESANDEYQNQTNQYQQGATNNNFEPSESNEEIEAVEPPDKINEPNFPENNQEEPENVDNIVSEEPENTEPENTSITTDQKIEEEINNNDDMDKDMAPTATKAPRSKQIGLSIASRCNNGDYVKNSSCTITPKTDLTLLSLYVYALDIGKVTITVTSSDGTNESIKVNLNSGRNQILLSELYLDMEKGKKYTIYAKAENARENIVTKLENAKSCAQSYYSNNDISINFNKSVCFFNIKYMVN